MSLLLTVGAGELWGDTASKEPSGPAQYANSPEKAEKTDNPSSKQIRTLGPPPGFEEADAPQTTLVDVYYGGRFLISALAEFTPDTIRFLQPGEIAHQIPDLLVPDSFSDALSAKLDTHAGLVCLKDGQPLCGRLEVDGAGVIFDERRFRADLFIQREWLKAPDPIERRYLPPPDHENLTLVQNLQSLYTNSSLGTERYSLFGNTRLASGNQFGFANWVSTDETSISVDEIGYRRDFRDHQLTLGLFETSTGMLRALPRQPMLGVSIGRSLKMRKDLDSAIASPIEVFLPSRSRVDILRDGRLISSAFYDVGIQLINTDRLPAGSYLVEIVITDSSGDTRSEEQLFVKSSLLAPPGDSLWFVELGDIRKRSGLDDSFPQHQGTPLIRSGYRWRHNHSGRLGFGVAGASIGDEHLGELSVNALFASLQAGGEIFATSQQGWGYSARAAGRWGNNNLSVSVQRVREDDFTGDTEDFRLLPTTQRLYNARLSRPLWGGQFGLNFSFSERVDGTRVRRRSLQYTHNLSFSSRSNLQWRWEIGDENGDFQGQLTLQWRNRRGNWRDSAKLAYKESETGNRKDGLTAGIASRWHDRNSPLGDVEIGARLESEDDDHITAGFDGDQRSAYGRLRGGFTAMDEHGQDINYSSLIGFDTSVLIGEEGGPVIGGPSPAEGGVIIDLRDTPEGRFDVMINGSRHTQAAGGKRIALTLPPYEEYRLSLIDRGTELISIDATHHEFPIYPGHTVTRRWSLTAINVLVARVFVQSTNCDNTGNDCQSEWQPLSNARIDGVEGYAVTDEMGFLQAEVDSNTRTLQAMIDGDICYIDLRPIRSEHNVMRASKLHCNKPD